MSRTWRMQAGANILKGDMITIDEYGLAVPTYTREDRLMEEQLRCTCGAWDKIEGAFRSFKNLGDGFVISYNDCDYDGMPPKRLALKLFKNFEHRSHEIDHVNWCDLPAAIMELADKVDPPKPKERGWEIGDVVGRKDGSLDPKIVRWLSPHEIGVFGFGAHISHSKSEYRNLTIEAEQAGEK
ncbi:hypothetical protein LCGC14_0517150 [marine sediment metagenome]|uniref:Uncharacterized protein n=1 Tax=marine sediment metagenome TaxID=412755 RepID=A0A0F9UL78_9ZZZZ